MRNSDKTYNESPVDFICRLKMRLENSGGGPSAPLHSDDMERLFQMAISLVTAERGRALVPDQPVRIQAQVVYDQFEFYDKGIAATCLCSRVGIQIRTCKPLWFGIAKSRKCKPLWFGIAKSRKDDGSDRSTPQDMRYVAAEMLAKEIVSYLEKAQS